MFLGALFPRACLEAWRLSHVRCFVSGVSYLGRVLPSVCAFNSRRLLFAVAQRWFSSEARVPCGSSSSSLFLNVAISQMHRTARPRNWLGISKVWLAAAVESAIKNKP